MKKTVHTFFSLLFTLCVSAQNVVVKDSAFTSPDGGQTLQLQSVAATDYNSDCSIKTYGYSRIDALTQKPAGGSQMLFDYNGDGSVLHRILQTRNSASEDYINSTRETFTYNATGAIVTDNSENWNGSTWVPNWQTNNTYDTLGRLIQCITQLSADGAQTLANSTQTVSSYDADGRMTQSKNFSWNKGGNAWSPVSQVLYGYDENGYLTTTLNQAWDDASGTWKDVDLTSFYNNSRGLPDSSMLQPAGSQSFSKTYYTYYSATSTLAQSTEYDWENDHIVSGFRSSYFHATETGARKDSTANEFYDAELGAFTLQFYTLYSNLYNDDRTLKAYISITGFPATQQFNYNQHNYTYGSCNNILPLTLLSFTGKIMNNDAMLHWQTTNESGITYYNVQRSLDGIQFTSLGNVAAYGNRTAQNAYVYTDKNINNLSADKLYYRLAEWNINGTVTYSPTIAVNKTATRLSLSVSPNPVVNMLVIYSPSAIDNGVCSISDLSGRILYTARQTVAANGKWMIDMSSFAKGTYLVTVQWAGGKEVRKVVK